MDICAQQIRAFREVVFSIQLSAMTAIIAPMTHALEEHVSSLRLFAMMETCAQTIPAQPEPVLTLR